MPRRGSGPKDKGRRGSEKGRRPEPEPVVHQPDLTAEEIAELEATTSFGAAEIAGPLYQRWAQVADQTGRAAASAICAMPELAMYPLVERLVALHNADKSAELTFQDYVAVMSALSGTETVAEKAQRAFAVCDCGAHGTMNNFEVFNLLRLYTGHQHSDEHLQVHHISIYPSMYRYICRSIYRSIDCSIDIYIYTSIHLSTSILFLYIHVYLHLFVNLYLYLSIYLSIYLSRSLYICVCVYIYI